MSDRFIKFIPSDEALYLLKNKGHAFRLLTIIAEAARRYEGDPDGLHIGEAFIGGYENYDMSEQNYRTAKEILEKRGHIQIIETCRTRKKSENGNTTISTKVKILSTNVFDINCEGVTTDFCKVIALKQKSNDRSNDRNYERKTSISNDRSNDRPTTDQRPTNDKQRIQEYKEVKEQQPQTPSSVVVFSCMENFVCEGLIQKEKIKICQENSEEIVKNAILSVTAPGFKPETSLLKSFRAAIKGKWKTDKPTMNDYIKNKELAEKLERIANHGYTFVCRNACLEIIKSVNSPSEEVKYDMTHDKFVKEVENQGKIKIKGIA